LIRQDSAYKKMASNDVLGRIINHEMNIQEANNIKNLYKGVSSSKKQDIALKATNKNKKKKAIIKSPSEEEEEEEDEDEDEKEYDEDEVALFIKNFNKLIKKEELTREIEERSQGQRECATITARIDTSLPNAHIREKKKTMRRKRSLTKAIKKIRNRQRRSPMVKLMLVKNGTQVMRVLSQKVMIWQSSPSRAKLHQASHSFQTSSSTHASWQKKGKIKSFILSQICH
jgi:hypothetical protein